MLLISAALRHTHFLVGINQMINIGMIYKMAIYLPQWTVLIGFTPVLTDHHCNAGILHDELSVSHIPHGGI
jgi:hypothetical protein